MAQCLGEPKFHAHCVYHKCELVENESYDNWMLYADLSGFYCPGEENVEESNKCEWRVSPIGRDDINVFELICGWH